SIINFFVTPVTRTEFLLGKQLPYVALGVLNFMLLVMLAATLFGVPVKGSILTLTAVSAIFILFSTGFGLLCSTFTRTQLAAIFVTMLLSLLPAVQFSGLINPVSSLEGAGAFIGRIFPATYALTVSRGVFNKALGFGDLQSSFWPVLAAVPVVLGIAVLLLRKQET
ncbi:MAG TPA: ABC transporter permease, partial [Steroidobacteraceae bacterium]|nr:ABC transporter permease [Steroidobacteraceae bacterium]